MIPDNVTPKKSRPKRRLFSVSEESADHSIGSVT